MKLLENVREVFKTLKHRKPSRIYCPRCCSSKISLHSSLDYGLMPSKYVCAECGYVGPVVLELEKEEESGTA
jgi:transcription elongation factor Elf1